MNQRKKKKLSPTESVAVISNRLTRVVTNTPTCWCLQCLSQNGIV